MPDQHEDTRAGVARKLKADPGVRALVADRVYDADPPAGAALPHLTVSKGKSYAPPVASAPVLTQLDVRVDHAAADQAVLHLLCVAAQRALNGSAGLPAYDKAVLTNTAPEDDADGRVSRRDTYGCFVRLRPSGAGVVGSPPGPPSGAGDPDEVARLRRELAAAKAALAALDTADPQEGK